MKHLQNRFSAHIADLQNQFLALGAGNRPDTLVITCTDTELNQAALPAMQNAAILVLRLPGCTIPTVNGDAAAMDAALTWALGTGICHLVICGHSQCSELPVSPGLDELLRQRAGLLYEPEQNLRNRLTDKARAGRRQVVRARQHVVDQLHALAEVRPVSDGLTAGAVNLHGLLYLHESGLFLHYRPEYGDFKPLISGE